MYHCTSNEDILCSGIYLSEDFAALANWQLSLLFGNYERVINVKLAIRLFELKLKVIIGDEDNIPVITNLLCFHTFVWPPESSSFRHHIFACIEVLEICVRSMESCSLCEGSGKTCAMHWSVLVILLTYSFTCTYSM